MAKNAKFHPNKIMEAVKEAIGQPGGPMEKAAIAVENEAKISMKSGGGSARVPSQRGTPPHTQTGVLRASIQHAPTSYGTQVIGPTEKYGAAHEFGAVIRPKQAQALAIPLTNVARKSGGPRNLPDLHIVAGDGGGAVLVDSKGTAQFALVKQVRIPKRPFMRPALHRAKKKFPKLFKGLPLANTKAGRWLNRQ